MQVKKKKKFSTLFNFMSLLANGYLHAGLARAINQTDGNIFIQNRFPLPNSSPFWRIETFF